MYVPYVHNDVFNVYATAYVTRHVLTYKNHTMRTQLWRAVMWAWYCATYINTQVIKYECMYLYNHILWSMFIYHNSFRSDIATDERRFQFEILGRQVIIRIRSANAKPLYSWHFCKRNFIYINECDSY